MQQFIFGLANGSIYALMALAIGMVSSTTGIVNFAHASVVMMGAMVSWWMMVIYHLSYLPALIIAIAVSMALNIIMYETCVKKLGNLLDNVGWIITLFGASIILDNIARMIFGTEPQAFPYLFGGKIVSVFDANIMLHELMMITIAVVIGIVYQTVIRRTRFGRAVRAVAFRPATAELMGIKSERIILSCFALAGAVAAVGGVLIAPITFASYTMTTSIGLKGFAAAVLGGFGDTKGAFIGGLILGLIESFISIFIPAGIKDSISFVIMIIVIIFLPGGIMSAKIFNKNGVSTEKV
jgi:branched-chain amino acid transport system permease protein